MLSAAKMLSGAKLLAMDDRMSESCDWLRGIPSPLFAIPAASASANCPGSAMPDVEPGFTKVYSKLTLGP